MKNKVAKHRFTKRYRYDDKGMDNDIAKQKEKGYQVLRTTAPGHGSGLFWIVQFEFVV